MYRPRPSEPRQQIIFDYSLHSRLSQLGTNDAVLFICNSQETLNSLTHLESHFSLLPMCAIIANPSLWTGATPDTPHLLDWEQPEAWRRYQTTDRWARIDLALRVGSLQNPLGYLIMPAHDAVWGEGLLSRLTKFSHQQARGGLPAAVSPYTYHQHSPLPGADIPPDIIHTMNTAFGRDSLFGWKLRLGRAQGFWGKMGMIPFAMCGEVRSGVQQNVWEDDLQIDSVIHQLGYSARTIWIRNPALYRQALPVFDRKGLKRVIERTLHYSLNIPGQTIGSSSLNFPLGALGQFRRLNPHFARYNALAEALIAECMQTIHIRLERYGASWVDWGAYRHVIRVGDPAVEVWKR